MVTRTNFIFIYLFRVIHAFAIFFLFCYCNTSTGYCHCLFSRWKSQVERSFFDIIFHFSISKTKTITQVTKPQFKKVSSARQQHFYLHPSFFFQPSILLSQNFTHAHTSFSNLNYTIILPSHILKIDLYIRHIFKNKFNNNNQTKNSNKKNKHTHTTIRQQTTHT